MGRIINETRVETVEELINALKEFPSDMRVSNGLSDYLQVYQIIPIEGEVVEDQRGIIVVDGE